MDRPIQKGDLVMVVKPCCSAHGGKIFRVSGFYRSNVQCYSCGSKYFGESLAFDERRRHCPTFMLKRLDPSALQDDIPTDEKVPAHG